MRLRPALVWLPSLAALGLLVALVGTGYDYTPLLPNGDEATDAAVMARASRGSPATREAARRYRRVEDALGRLQPRGNYIVVDQTHNRLRLMRGGKVVLEAPCSAGSGMVLREGSRGRRWVFDTPRGRFQVISKLRYPVWRKPDWAFIEEGEPVPTDPSSRFEYGVLGEYALYFGDGYMIHGTLYERLLGRNVTHGCIRLGREPLRRVYHESPLGTPIFIF